MFVILIFTLFFAFLDRLSGGWPQVPGRGQYYTILLIPVAMLLGIGWEAGLAVAMAFMLWRMPAWRLFGGSLAPYPDEYFGTFLRHTLASVALLAAWLVTKQELSFAAILGLVLFPTAATLLGILNRHDADQGIDINAAIELCRGAFFGLVASIPFIGH